MVSLREGEGREERGRGWERGERRKGRKRKAKMGGMDWEPRFDVSEIGDEPEGTDALMLSAPFLQLRF